MKHNSKESAIQQSKAAVLLPDVDLPADRRQGLRVGLDHPTGLTRRATEYVLLRQPVFRHDEFIGGSGAFLCGVALSIGQVCLKLYVRHEAAQCRQTNRSI